MCRPHLVATRAIQQALAKIQVYEAAKRDVFITRLLGIPWFTIWKRPSVAERRIISTSFSVPSAPSSRLRSTMKLSAYSTDNRECSSQLQNNASEMGAHV
jgi:hypothetical protein